MSLTLLPAVDVRDGKAVRLRQGESGSETDYGSPFEAARTWVEAGAEWIHLVDLDAAFGTGNNRDQLREIVHELGDRVNIELSGGVRDDASLDAALEAGAARVNIGTAALDRLGHQEVRRPRGCWSGCARSHTGGARLDARRRRPV